MSSAVHRPASVRFVVRIVSPERATAEKIARRLKTEYGQMTELQFIETESGGESFEFWIALERPTAPSDLPSLAVHLRRVSDLYRGGPGNAAVTVEPGYIDSRRVVRASYRDDPRRLYLGQGIWGELVGIVDAEGGIVAEPSAPDPWTSDHAIEFFKVGLQHLPPPLKTSVESEKGEGDAAVVV